MSLGTQVKKYRDAGGLSYPELSELSGVEIGTINALEKRHSRRSEHGPALARALGLTLEQLLDVGTDHSDLVRVHQARRRALTAGQTTQNGMRAAENVAAYPIAASAWPFVSITPEQFRASLDREDIDRIEAYIQAVIDTRTGERLKNGG